ncbi:MAG TPA: restriction endonuclease subunit S [Bacteroidales bacterium]|nr:restriction endonuclease subunit S [Bacteroidales bacterium]
MNNNSTIYKDSPLGKIPDDWEVKRVDEFAPLQRGFDLPVEKIITGEYPVVFSNGILKFHNEFKSMAPGVVTGRSGTIGKVTFVEKEYWPHNTALWVTDFKGNEPKFVYYFYVHFDLARFSSGSGVPTLNRNDVHQQKIILPPLPEQKAIAHVLGLMDLVINTNNQLIAQKELQKKWLMQNLLTGKRRLKGFESEKWKTKLLEDILIPVTRPVDKPTSSFLALGIRSHGKGTFLKHEFEPAKIDMDTLFVVSENDLIVNITFAWEGAIAIVGKQDEGALVSHRFPTYTFNAENGIIDYFRHYILQPRFKYLLDLISPGGAGRNRVLSKKDFLKLEVRIPSPQEQNAIGQVLQAADKEIQMLKAKAEKLREQKKGLMQVLLTGKKRLKV